MTIKKNKTCRSLGADSEGGETEQVDLLEAMRRPQRDLASCSGTEAWELKRCSLVDLDEPWDAIRLNLLPRLVDIDEEPQSNNFVLRPFWRPDMELAYQISIYSAPPASTSRFEIWQDIDITRKLLKCSTPEYVWKDVVQILMKNENSWLYFGEKTVYVFSFNQLEQSLKVKSFDDERNTVTNFIPTTYECRALWVFPVIPPFGLVHVGHSWKVDVGDSYMKYHIEEYQVVSGMPIVMIRRKGRLRIVMPSTMSEKAPEYSLLSEVSGLTTWSLNHGIALEDRVLLKSAIEDPGPVTRSVMRLREIVTNGTPADGIEIED